jgi:hypothetical protein
MCGEHLNGPEDLGESLPKFHKGTKSILSKYLTKIVWDQYKDKTDKFGFTFKQKVYSGCKNTDSGIGGYTGSHDAYKVFADGFSLIRSLRTIMVIRKTTSSSLIWITTIFEGTSSALHSPLMRML